MSRWFVIALLGCSNTPPTANPPAVTPVPVEATAPSVQPTLTSAPTPPALPEMTREAFDLVVEDTFETVFESCISAHPRTAGEHSVEVTLWLRPGRDPDVEAPIASPAPEPALEDCIVDQLVQVELPAFAIDSELEFTYKIKERADGSRVKIFGTMIIFPSVPVQSS
jgi:hypothetical protein